MGERSREEGGRRGDWSEEKQASVMPETRVESTRDNTGTLQQCVPEATVLVRVAYGEADGKEI